MVFVILMIGCVRPISYPSISFCSIFHGWLIFGPNFPWLSRGPWGIFLREPRIILLPQLNRHVLFEQVLLLLSRDCIDFKVMYFLNQCEGEVNNSDSGTGIHPNNSLVSFSKADSGALIAERWTKFGLQVIVDTTCFRDQRGRTCPVIFFLLVLLNVQLSNCLQNTNHFTVIPLLFALWMY